VFSDFDLGENSPQGEKNPKNLKNADEDNGGTHKVMLALLLIWYSGRAHSHDVALGHDGGGLGNGMVDAFSPELIGTHGSGTIFHFMENEESREEKDGDDPVSMHVSLRRIYPIGRGPH